MSSESRRKQTVLTYEGLKVVVHGSAEQFVVRPSQRVSEDSKTGGSTVGRLKKEREKL